MLFAEIGALECVMVLVLDVVVVAAGCRVLLFSGRPPDSRSICNGRMENTQAGGRYGC